MQRTRSHPPPPSSSGRRWQQRAHSTSRLIEDASDGAHARAPQNLKQQVKHTKSVADVDSSGGAQQGKAGFAFPNLVAPLAMECGDVDEVS